MKVFFTRIYERQIEVDVPEGMDRPAMAKLIDSLDWQNTPLEWTMTHGENEKGEDVYES